MQEIGQQLSHILWLGGSPYAGKSSIVQLLAGEYGLHPYHCDEALGQHLPRLTPEVQPMLFKWSHTAWDTLWMRPVQDLLDETIAAYEEHFGLVLEDLLALPTLEPILAEGNCLVPHCVHRVVAQSAQAIWVISTEDFQRTHYPSRGPWVQDILDQCQDPAQALQNWMDRDVEFARWVKGQVEALGYRLLVVDGSRTIDQNAELVAAHLGLAKESQAWRT